MFTKNLRNWTDPEIAEEAMEALRREMRQAGEDPESGITMCHRQGKTAVYLSDDGRSIIEHEPDGTITRTPFSPSDPDPA